MDRSNLLKASKRSSDTSLLTPKHDPSITSPRRRSYLSPRRTSTERRERRSFIQQSINSKLDGSMSSMDGSMSSIDTSESEMQPVRNSIMVPLSPSEPSERKSSVKFADWAEMSFIEDLNAFTDYDNLYYNHDEMAEFRHSAFLEECGLDSF
jgi:hypothetical protein